MCEVRTQRPNNGMQRTRDTAAFLKFNRLCAPLMPGVGRSGVGRCVRNDIFLHDRSK
jgi:hypothetical protein